MEQLVIDITPNIPTLNVTLDQNCRLVIGSTDMSVFTSFWSFFIYMNTLSCLSLFWDTLRCLETLYLGLIELFFVERDKLQWCFFYYSFHFLSSFPIFQLFYSTVPFLFLPFCSNQFYSFLIYHWLIQKVLYQSQSREQLKAFLGSLLELFVELLV